MRLRWGPHRDHTPEQVLIRDPQYVLQMLDQEPHGVLAAIFRDLVLVFDALPLKARCARCGGRACHLYACPGSVDLIGHCRSCLLISAQSELTSAVWIAGYEDALRHVCASFRRGLRINMRRIIVELWRAKGGPPVATEAACRDFLHPAGP